MTLPSASPTPEDYLGAIEEAFARCPNYSGLRLVSSEVRDNHVAVHFEGPIDDFRGPYGALVQLPRNRQDEVWTRHSEGDSLGDWAQAAIINRALEAHTRSLQEDRGYSPDGIWWLVDDTTRGVTVTR